MNIDRKPQTLESAPERSINKEDPGYVGPTLIVYRQNDFLDANVERMRQAIDAAGGEVQVHVFPAGTPPEVIDAWYQENAGLLDGKRLFTDMTSRYSGAGPKESMPYLDNLITHALWNTAVAKSGGPALETIREHRGNLESLETAEAYDRSLTTLVRLILDNLDPLRVPGHVYVVKDRITDHYPVPLDVAVEGGELGDRPQHSDELLSTVAGRTKAALIAAGLPESDISVVASTSDLLTEADNGKTLVSAPGDWILIDRHVLKNARKSENMDDEELVYVQQSSMFTAAEASPEEFREASADGTQGIILRLPFGDLMSDAKGFKLLTFSTEGMETELLKEVVG